MAQPLPAVLTSPGRAADMGRARRFLWGVFWLWFLSTLIGLAWDRAWHLTHVFDNFYTPAHLWTYGMTSLSAALVAWMAFTPSLRPAFGAGFRLPLLPVRFPGSLVSLGGGFVTLAIAGGLDDIWHTSFGLDETAWSTPHALIGWGLLMILLGFVSCRLALRPRAPWRGFSYIAMLLLMLMFSVKPFLGPLDGNKTVESVRAIATVPVLAAQPAFQHTTRIYATWNLTRTNPLLAVLGGLWCGTLLAALRGLDRRPHIWIGVITLWTVINFFNERGTARRFDQVFGLRLLSLPAAWLPLPILPAALTLCILLALRVHERWAYPLVGGLFGWLIAYVWTAQPRPLLEIAGAAAAMAVGSLIGTWVCRVLVAPTRTRILGLLAGGIGFTFITGLIDLYLRRMTP